MGLDDAGGDLWEGVAFYHSHNPDYKRTYLASVLTDVLRLQQEAHANASAPSASPSPSATARHGFMSNKRPKGN
jgi:hypothetical protein